VPRRTVLVLIVSGVLYVLLFGSCVSGGLGPGNPISRIQTGGDLAIYFLGSLVLLVPLCLALGWAIVAGGRTILGVVVWGLLSLARAMRDDLSE